jgi:class 3 adenylate cyclase/tetratricopeptide (TPR) repeat protein
MLLPMSPDTAPVPEQRCTECGEAGPGRARFCPNCGSPLVGSEGTRQVRKTVTVVFCDLVGSTELGEQLDPEALRELLDRYFAVLRTTVQRHGGTVEKFIGDAVMAVFGIPVLHEDDALRAARAAAEIPAAVQELEPELQRRWPVRLRVRVGVSTGEVMAAPGTGGQRLATGDAVNVAARLQSLAGPDQILLSEATFRLVRGFVRAEPLDAVAVKGKAEPVRPYRLVAVDRDPADQRPLAPFRGRAGELDDLRRAWADALAGSRPLRRIVVGGAGAGKSRLIEEFLSGSVAGARVLRGRCPSYGQGVTFWPIREMLGSAANWGEDDSADLAVAKLAELMPRRTDARTIAATLAQLVGVAPPSAGLPETFRAMTQLLEELASEGPLVVVLDDLHWAEETLLELAEHVLTAARGPLLLVGGARPELLDVHADWAGGAGERLVLEPLSEPEASALIDGLLSPLPVPEALRRRLLDTAEGNPLFVEQLVAMLLEDGLLRSGEGRWTLTRELGPGVLPTSISTLLSARLDRLPAAERRETEVGAVVGRVFWRGAVAELARDVVGPGAGEHLVGLVRRGLIQPEPWTFPADDAYKFTHVLIRDAAYNGMPKGDRAAAHERFADWLEQAAGARAAEYDEVLGYHLEQAVLLRAELGLPDDADRRLALRAGRRLAAAGGRAYDRGDISTTIGLLSRAAQLLPDELPERLEVTTDLGYALSLAGNMPEAESMLAATLERARNLGDRGAEMRARIAHLDLGSWTDVTWDATAAESVALEAVSVLTALGDDRGLAGAWWLIGRLRLDAGHAHDAEPALERALDHGRRSGRVRAMCEPTIWLIIALSTGPTPVAVVAERLARIARDTAGNLEVECEVLRTSAVLAAKVRDFERARRLNAQAERLFTELGLSSLGASACGLAAFEIARCEGDLPAVEEDLSRVCARLEEAGEKGVRSTLLAMLAHAQCARGAVEEAQTSAGLAESLTQQSDLFSAVLWRTARAKVLSWRGEADTAESLAQEAVTLAAGSDWLSLHGDALLDLAEVRQRAGRFAAAESAAAAALGLYDREGDLASGDRAREFITGLRRLRPR